MVFSKDGVVKNGHSNAKINESRFKINSKLIIEPNEKCKAIKILKDNVEENLHDHGMELTLYIQYQRHEINNHMIII